MEDNKNKENKDEKRKFNFSNKNKNTKGFNLDNAPLIQDSEARLESAFAEEESEQPQPLPEPQPGPTATPSPTRQGNNASPVTARKRTAATTVQLNGETASETKKNVQAMIPLSLYARLVNLKIQRGQNIRDMIGEALEFWVRVQESQK